MNRYIILFILIFYIIPGQAQRIPLSPEKWDYQEKGVEFLEYKGQQAIKLSPDAESLFYKDFIFKDGIIEFDVEVNQASPFPTIYFRAQDAENTEHVYLRTGAAQKANDFNAVQYASIIKGVNLWDLQHEFQSAANLKVGDWNHIKLVVSGKQLRVFINNQATPNLEIPCMEGNFEEGLIGIGTGFLGQSIFANLVVKPNETEGLPSLAGPDISKHDTRYLRNWQVSNPIALANGQEVNFTMLPKADTKWGNIQAERRGLVNLSRKFGASDNRRFVWLRTVFSSASVQTQTLKLGFSDEIWVFVNGKPVYLDKNLYGQNMRKSPNGRISLDNSAFPINLQEGENEILIAVANDFFGWGIMARLEHLNGIEY